MRLSILKAASPNRPMPIVENGEPDARYPRNAKGQPEFGSVILTLDHLVESSDIHYHQKAVYSTETAAEALLSLMHDYYPKLGAPALSMDKATFEILKQLDDSPDDSIALFFVPVVRDRTGGLIVQVILSQIALQRLVTHPAYGNGSALLAMNELVNTVVTLADRTVQQVGKVPPLLLIQLQDAADGRAEQRASA